MHDLKIGWRENKRKEQLQRSIEIIIVGWELLLIISAVTFAVAVIRGFKYL